MRVYIATSLENAGGHNSIWGAIKAAVPHAELTYDWTEHGSVQGDGEARIRAVAIAEAEGVMSADLVVALLPGGRGTHVEIGIAIGAGVPVLLLVTPEHEALHPRTCAFYHHPGVRRVHSDRELVTVVEAFSGDAADWGGLRRRHLEDEVRSMRDLQRRYFKTRDGGVLQRSKQAEHAVDDLLSSAPLLFGGAR